MENKIKMGFCICGSFCTFSKIRDELYNVCKEFDVSVIMSNTSYSTDTRFGKASDFIKSFEQISGKPVIHTLDKVEPIGPKKLLDIIVIAPCTGNTIAKLANGITDTTVTLAAKAHLRNKRPVVIAVSTNDALGANGKNIMTLMNTKNIYFVPFNQDDPIKKESSIVADFTKIIETSKMALSGKQIQPVIYN